MNDQADTLRKMMRGRPASTPHAKLAVPASQVITVSSGKGGVGKTALVANLGTMLARRGQRVLLVDGDLGLANLDIMLGVQPGSATLEQVLEGEAKVQDAVVGVEPNLWLLPASSGLSDVKKWDEPSRARLAGLFDQCPWEMDVILVDSSSGIQENVLSLHGPAYQSVVILTPEPTSLTDAYGLVKLLRRKSGVTHVSAIVNQVTDAREAQRVFQSLKDVAARFVDSQLSYLGHVSHDEKIAHSVMKRKILLDLYPGADAIACLDLIAKRIGAPGRFKEEPALSAPRNTAGFWRSLLGEVKTC